MRSILVSAVALSLILGSPVVKTASASETNQVALIAEDRREVMKENAENRQEFRQETRDAVLERIANRVEERFARHEERLQNWIDRATTHLEKRQESGKDVTAAMAALETAKTSLATASKLGDDAVAKLRAVTPENWADQKADALAAREAVKKAQVVYAQVVKDMKQVLVSLKKAE